MKCNGRLRTLLSKNGHLALLALFRNDISMMSSTGPGVRMDDVAGIRGNDMVVGCDTGLTSQGRVVSGFGRTAKAPWRFWAKGLCHTSELDTWRVYNGNIAHLLDAKAQAVGAWKRPPTIDLGWARSNGWREGECDGGL